MLRDVFYFGEKPNVHPREKFAVDLADARSQSTTEHFWIINEFCDYRGFDWDFDFEFLPDEDVWAQDHNNVWPSQHQKDSGTWLCPKEYSNVTVYRQDVDVVKRKAVKNSNWVLVNEIEEDKFDFSWHPDPTDPPYIYVFPTIWNPVGGPEYHVKGATEKKYINSQIGITKVVLERWNIPSLIDIDGFDFTWVPHPEDPPYIYEFGTQHQKTGGPQYIVEGATEKKYVDFQKVKALPNKEKWIIPTNIDVTNFDFSWHPDSTDPAYIYQFGTQWALSGGPKYIVDDAKEIKYMDNMTAVALPNKDNWEIPAFIDSENFDYSWHPYSEDEPYIYQFGTQHQKTGGPKYITPGVHKNSQVKYIDTRILKAKRLPNKKNFAILNNYKVKEFDYSWHPDTTEEPFIYVFGSQWYPPEVMPVMEYIVPGAKQIKYVTDVIVKLDTDMTNWVVPDNIDVTEFDFSWKPNPKDPIYIYQFGTQHQKTGGPRYVIPDATDVKYIDIQKAKALPNKNNWHMPIGIPIDEFDYSWHPDTTDDSYIYVFPTQWQLTAGPKYIVDGATQVKYMDYPVAKAGVNMTNWVIPKNIVIDHFDYSWHPHPDDPMYVYHFATQWHDRGGPMYVPPHANKDTPEKYIDGRIIKATLGTNMNNWEVPGDVDVTDFDFSWVPHPNDPPFIYQFGTQWQKTNGPIYKVEDAIEVKYIDGPRLRAKKLPSKKYWVNPYQSNIDNFDFSWHPDETSPPYIYQFGTLADINDGPRYMSPNATGDVVHLNRVEIKIAQPTVNKLEVKKYYIKTTLDELVKEHPSELFWALRENINYTDFDFEWRPNIEQAQYVHVFGSSESEITQTYFVNAVEWLNGKRDFNYIDNKKLDDETLVKLFNRPAMFFVDRNNEEAKNRYEKLKAKFPDIQKTRYLNTWVDTISRCINRSTTELCWILNSELDYSDFDFEYYPNPWQMKMVHVFGTQWSHWGTTFLVNRDTFGNDTKYIKTIEHLNNLNFVKDQNKRAKATSCLYDIFVIDHGNKEMFKVFRQLQNKANGKSVTNVDYKGNYLDTFKEILKQVPDKKENYIWICSSVCDYSSFDFTYICDPFAREQLHVFPSDTQKYGDTFLVNVNKLRELIENMNTLQEYDKINFNRHLTAVRYPAPEIISDDDTHTSSLDIRFDYPYVVLTTQDNKDIEKLDYEPLNLWSSETKNIVITSNGATRVVVPKEAKDIVKREFYDYPYIVKSSRLAKSKPLDIVFLSNGEKCADENYEHLLKVTNGLTNRIVRVDGVNGRVNAYHAAANASETPWMFTVFAKLKVSNKFDWNWQPDRLQVPKHYVFHAKNPVNGLVYGHQAMIAYNKKMTLNNAGRGLDFTQDDLHEVLNINSGVANFNVDEWTTWRTAFRECIKLCTFADDVSNERLKVWTTVAEGDFAQYCLDGANDAVEYFDEVAGDYDALKLSYDWVWLKEKFNKKYKK